MNPDDMMPCGNCAVCGEYLDHRHLGVCARCGNGFHFNACGGWNGGEHVCNDCQSDAASAAEGDGK
jgi:hypothetical protein